MLIDIVHMLMYNSMQLNAKLRKYRVEKSSVMQVQKEGQHNTNYFFSAIGFLYQQITRNTWLHLWIDLLNIYIYY